MTMIRPSFKPPFSRSAGTCKEISGDDLVSSGARTRPDREIEFRGGVGRSSVLLVGTNSMVDKSSDMMNPGDKVTQHESEAGRIYICETFFFFLVGRKLRRVNGVTQHAAKI